MLIMIMIIIINNYRLLHSVISHTNNKNNKNIMTITIIITITINIKHLYHSYLIILLKFFIKTIIYRINNQPNLIQYKIYYQMIKYK